MADSPIQSLYSQRAQLYQTFFVKFLQWEKVLLAYFQANPSLQPGMKILDAGCGTGSVTKVLYHLANRHSMEQIVFHAFDLTPAMLDLFRRWMDSEGVSDIQLQQADVLRLDEQLPPHWTDYDLIVSSAMFEYIPNESLDQALTNLRQRLANDGRLLTFLTRRTRVTQWTGARWWGTNLFTPEEFTQKLQQSGFTAIRLPPLPPKWNSFMMAVEAAAHHPKG